MATTAATRISSLSGSSLDAQEHGATVGSSTALISPGCNSSQHKADIVAFAKGFSANRTPERQLAVVPHIAQRARHTIAARRRPLSLSVAAPLCAETLGSIRATPCSQHDRARARSPAPEHQRGPVLALQQDSHVRRASQDFEQPTALQNTARQPVRRICREACPCRHNS